MKASLVILAIAGLFAEPVQYGSDGRITSTDLLKLGFEDVAQGELMTMRKYELASPMDLEMLRGPKGCWDSAKAFVASTDVRSLKPECAFVPWSDEEYAPFVRLKRGVEEFVCVFGAQEECHRATGGGI